jgi:hypothetical protein
MVDRIRLKWANEAGHGSQAEYVLASDYDTLFSDRDRLLCIANHLDEELGFAKARLAEALERIKELESENRNGK